MKTEIRTIREPRKFIVWEVFGMSGGNMRLLARFHFKEEKNANALARTIVAGYVIRSHVESEPKQWESFAEGDHISTLPKPATARPVAVASVVDTLPPITLPRADNWC